MALAGRNEAVAAEAGQAGKKLLATFKEYPTRQRAANFTIDQAMEKLRQSIGQ
jgi:hypothetical protein